jgi:hypothetical protein
MVNAFIRGTASAGWQWFDSSTTRPEKALILTMKLWKLAFPANRQNPGTGKTSPHSSGLPYVSDGRAWDHHSAWKSVNFGHKIMEIGLIYSNLIETKPPLQ